MKKEFADYLLRCPVCNKKMWFVGADAHRKSVHPQISMEKFEKLLITKIKSGEIKPKRFEKPNQNFVSATNRINTEKIYNKHGITSVVSGGKTK